MGRAQGNVKLRMRCTATLALVGGALAWGSLGPLSAWPLVLVCLVPLAQLCAETTPRRGFVRGLACGFCINLGIFYWLVPTVHRFAHMPWLASLPVGMLLLVWQALPFAVVGWVLARVGWVLLSLPASLVAVEFLWPSVFPWHIGFPLAQAPIVVQAADLGGYGIASLLVGITSAAVAWPKRATVAIAAGIWAVVLTYGALRMAQVDALRARAPEVRIGLVQPNFAPVQKEAPKGEQREDRLERLQTATQELERKGAQVVLWPESAYPYRIERDQPDDFYEGDRRRVGEFRVPLLFGARTGERGQPKSNSVILREPSGQFAQRYDKIFLMPFGETLPLYEPLKSLWDAIPNISQMLPGKEPVTLHAAGARLGPMICVEDLEPASGRELVRHGANVLVNFTNDAWFGTSVAADHHLQSARFRAIETRRDLVRVTLTGMTAHVDAAGRLHKVGQLRDIAEQAPPETVVVTAAKMAGKSVAVRAGNAFPWLAVATTLWLLARKRNQSETQIAISSAHS